MSGAPLTAKLIDQVLLETYRQAAGFAAPPEAHAHEEVQIGLNVNAGGLYRYRGAVHPIGVGELAFVAGGERHRPGDGRPAADGGEYRTVYLPTDTWRRALRRAGLNEIALRQPVLSDPPLAGLLMSMHRFGDAERPADLSFDIQLESFMARLTLRLGGEPRQRRTAGVRRLERVRSYLHANADRPVRLGELAQLAGMAPAHLCRSFSDAFGAPPHRYQTALRVSRARRLLLRGETPGAVAARLGFADGAHFGRVFRAHVGVTPGRYARDAGL